MTEHYPTIRIRAKSGALLIREALNFTFYLRHPHHEIAQRVLRALESYLQVSGPDSLSLYSEEAGAWLRLDAARWEGTRQQFLHPQRASIHLVDESSGESRYRFDYDGKPLGTPSLANEPQAVSAVSFWLPTEYLEEQGAARVRALAMELASPLPFCSGHAGLSFHCDLGLVGVEREVRKWCLRYPGLDIPDLDRHALRIGTRVRAISWLTFLGQPVLGQVGGVAGLRSRLLHPGTTVEEMEAGRAVVTLGARPEAGDTEEGHVLPAYRELARVLEPLLYFEMPSGDTAHASEELRRWERRFLE